MKQHLVKLLLSAATATLLLGCTNSEPQHNTMQADSQWRSLFNGKNLDGWTPKFAGYAAGVNYKNTYRVEDGLLTVSYDDWQDFDNKAYGHLFTNESFSNYRIRVEYRFIGEQVVDSPKMKWAFRNNGVMIHSQPVASMKLDQSFPLSAEAQLLGGDGTEERQTANLCSPSTNIVKDGKLIKKHCLKSSSKTYHGDQWVWFEAEVSGDGPIKHFINGELVFEFDELQADPESEDGKTWLENGNPLKITQGQVSLQAETHPIQFRRIEIKALN